MAKKTTTKKATTSKPTRKKPTTKSAATKKAATRKPSAQKTPTKTPAKSVTKAPPASRPAVGTRAPDFTLTDQSGTAHTLSAYRGRPVVLFFYPKDMTSGCTVEACDFNDRLPAFGKSKAAVLGVSILNARSKQKFAAKEGLTYPLLADDRVNADGKPDPEVAQRYGVWIQKSMYGKPYMGIDRTTFLIAPDGTIARRWDGVEIDGHAEEVLRAVKELD
jgi:peroxiredoxin Q/BCP